MKKIFWLLLLSASCLVTLAQQKKPVPKEKPPTNKEMVELLREAKKSVDELSPEDKRLMDSLGIKVPSSKNVPKFTDKQLAESYAEDGLVIPTRKTNLINALPKKILSGPELNTYMTSVNTQIAAMVTPQSKEVAEKTISQFRNDKYYGAMIASAANGLWIMGLKEPAVYLMGKAIEVLPNSDNYNNFAAFLTMTGAAHVAIPVLEKLNSVHHKNSTIYNNLGQAWLQLGDGIKAEKYLDSAIMVYAYHPQANFTKCLILESQGRIAEAAAALRKSLNHSVTKSKLAKLKDLEGEKSNYHPYQLKKTYFSASFDLGSYVAMVPNVYADAPGPEVEEIWDEFREKMHDIITSFDAEISRYTNKADEEVHRIQSKVISQRGIVFSPYYYKAVNYYFGNDFTSDKVKQEGEADIKYIEDGILIKQKFDTALQAERDRFEKRLQSGENLGSNTCEGELPIIKAFLLNMNELNKSYREQHVRQWVTDAFNAYNFVTDVAIGEASAQIAVLQIKKDFVYKLSELNHESYTGLICADPKKDNEKKPPKKLPDFDKVNCKMKSTLYVPYAGQITIRCNEMDVVFNPGLLPFKASWTEDFNSRTITDASVAITIKAIDISASGKFDEEGNFISGNLGVGTTVKGIEVSANGEFNANGFTKGSLELGIDGSLSLLPDEITDAAPVDLSMKGELSAGMELGPDGIEDMYVNEKTTIDAGAKAEADIGKDGKQALDYINKAVQGQDVKIPSPSLEAGASISADNRMSMNSGYSVNRSTEFSGLLSK